MIWAVDIGNSRTVSGRLKGLRVLRRRTAPTPPLRGLSAARAWARGLKRLGGADRVVVSSVVPPVDGPVRRALGEVFGRRPDFVVPGDPGLSIPVRYRRPREVGADRVVNGLAARHLFGAPVIVVDYGTGTTFDVVDAAGAYRGGVIVPGIGMSLKAMHDQTAKLPLVRFAKVRRTVGRTTADAIRSGIYYGTLGETREILARIRAELGAPRCPAVATGGWCGVFRGSGLFKAIAPDLTLQGLSLFAEEA
ncbi:MAG TPA: type III pantothenate kinase [bacterium]|nr:type III pantothenate kinase [bacterium]